MYGIYLSMRAPSFKRERGDVLISTSFSTTRIWLVVTGRTPSQAPTHSSSPHPTLDTASKTAKVYHPSSKYRRPTFSGFAIAFAIQDFTLAHILFQMYNHPTHTTHPEVTHHHAHLLHHRRGRVHRARFSSYT